jgi:ParB/RepB/Spo0J family partition protein
MELGTTTDAIVALPLAQIHDSPFNPRQKYTGLQELADNIKNEGRVHQALLVRPRRLDLLRDDLTHGWELVFGHRRKRAATMAGLATVPCVVREMTDAEVRSAQAAENLQRENISALEEAQGYQDMIAHDGLTPKAVAERVGKSPSHVYGRLTLLQAVPEVRQALLDGDVGSEAALLVTRLRGPKIQAKALQAIKARNQSLQEGGRISFRRIRELLAEQFTLDLHKALFQPGDAFLLPDVGTCFDCPKRSGNAPEFSDLVADRKMWEHHTIKGSAHLCTDPDCYAAKKSAHLALQAATLQQQGKQVVAGAKAAQAISACGEVKGAYVALDAKVQAALKKLPKGKQPPAVHIQNPRDGKVVIAVRREDLLTAGLAGVAADRSNGRAAEQQRHEARQQKLKQEAKEESQRRLELLRHVRTLASGRAWGVFELRLAVHAALYGVDYTGRDTLAALHGKQNIDQVRTLVDTADAATLNQVLLDCLLLDNVEVEHYSIGNKPAPLLALAEHYGVDAAAVMRSAQQPAMPVVVTTTRKVKPAARAIRYRQPLTGETWSGRGQTPAWLRAALEQGKALADFDLAAAGVDGAELG